MSAAALAQRLVLYRALTEAEVVETTAGGHVLAAVHPREATLGTLGAPWGTDAAGALRAGERWLRERGCTRVVGPMEVCTWFPYRARLGSDPAPAFFGEPVADASAWTEAGYAVEARYASTVVPCAAAIAHAEARRPRGVVVRPMDGWEETLRCIHHLSHAAFAEARAFAPLPLPALEALYRPLQSRVDPGLVLLAEREGEPLAFVLGFEDPAAGPGRIVLKSLAVHPSARQEGIGTWLVGELHREAARRGFHDGIHALMSQEGQSQRICREASQPLREYALFGRELT